MNYSKWLKMVRGRESGGRSVAVEWVAAKVRTASRFVKRTRPPTHSLTATNNRKVLSKQAASSLFRPHTNNKGWCWANGAKPLNDRIVAFDRVRLCAWPTLRETLDDTGRLCIGTWCVCCALSFTLSNKKRRKEKKHGLWFVVIFKTIALQKA